MGIDPSLSSTGWAVREGTTVVTGHINTKGLSGPWRLNYVRVQLAKLVERYQPELVSYEDYAHGTLNGRVYSMGELGGVLKTFLWVEGIDVILVSPTSLKLFVTGNGQPGRKKKGQTKLTDKQKKALISEALLRDFSLDIQQNDEADAAGLLLFGELHAGIDVVPKTSLESIRRGAVSECIEVRGKMKLIAKQ